MLTNSAHITGVTKIENDARPNSSFHCRKGPPRGWKARFGWKTQPGGIEATARNILNTGQNVLIWCRETAKQRAVRIDGAGRPPEECQRYDRSPVHRRLSAPGRLSPGLNACATSHSTK